MSAAPEETLKEMARVAAEAQLQFLDALIARTEKSLADLRASRTTCAAWLAISSVCNPDVKAGDGRCH